MNPRKNHFNKVVLCFYGVFMPFSGVYMFCKRNNIILNTEKTRSKTESIKIINLVYILLLECSDFTGYVF